MLTANAARCVVGAFAASAASFAWAAATVISGVGGNNTSVTPGSAQVALLSFQAVLGGASNGSSGPQTDGFRTITWDAVPNSLASPNLLPANYFNSDGHTRGVMLITPGSGVAVSQGITGPNANFGDIDPSYATNFQAFSPARLFAPIDSNIVQVYFYAAGTNLAAGTRGFGAIFNDVEAGGYTSLRLFDLNGADLGTWYLPGGANAESQFLGIAFAPSDPPIGHAVITLGTYKLGGAETLADLVVMDDFVYGEPIVDEIFGDGFD